MDFNIDSDGGRLGPFWWINADTRPVDLFKWFEAEDPRRFIRFGISGFGSKAYVRYTSID